MLYGSSSLHASSYHLSVIYCLWIHRVIIDVRADGAPDERRQQRALLSTFVFPASSMAQHHLIHLLLLGIMLDAALSEFVGAAVLPHGDFAFDPSLLFDAGSRLIAQSLRSGSDATGMAVVEMSPDVIVLSTPHGLQTSWDVAVYENSQLEGVATVGRDLEESYGHPFPKKLYDVKLNAKTDVQLAQQVASALTASHSNVTLLKGWNGVLPLPLHWGEVLALEHVEAKGQGASLPPLVSIGLPLSRYNHSAAVADGFRAMGRTLGKLFEASDKRVAFVVSTDLAHRHWANTSFGFSPHAASFDAAVGRWAAELDTRALVQDSAAHVDTVYSCGWLGLMLLHGALEASARPGAPLNASWTPTLTAGPVHPTYYGMMSATFTKPRDDRREGRPRTSVASASAPFPLYKQCDDRWGGDLMGVEGPGHRATVCREGCAMSCVAMALRGLEYDVPGTGAVIDPGTLNAYLGSHGLYHCDKGDCDNLVLNAPDAMTGGRLRYVGEWPVASMPMRALPGLTSREAIYLAHVRSPRTGHVSHFVLLTAFHNATGDFSVLDPGYSQSRYALVNVSDVLFYEALPSTAVVPLAYPLFKQCDPAWASDRIHVKTICDVGCLMSSTSMALRQRGILIPGDDTPERNATPGALNEWLRTHGGYVSGMDDLDEAAIARLAPGRIAWTNASMHRTNDLSWGQVVALINAGAAVIANVMEGHHFVLVVGYDDALRGDVLFVNDPGFTKPSYSYAKDVVGWRLYAMAQSHAEDINAQLDVLYGLRLP